MQTLTIISGPQASGKTTLAHQISGNLHAVTITHQNHLKEAMEVDPDIIILDEATLPLIEMIIYHIINKTFTYRPPYSSKKITKPFPNVIACTNQDIKEEDIRGIAVEFIKLKK